MRPTKAENTIGLFIGKLYLQLALGYRHDESIMKRLQICWSEANLHPWHGAYVSKVHAIYDRPAPW